MTKNNIVVFKIHCSFNFKECITVEFDGNLQFT